VGHHPVQVPFPLVKGGQVLVEEGVVGAELQGPLVKVQSGFQLSPFQVQSPQVGDGPVVKGV
jgi:hypothetical protein